MPKIIKQMNDQSEANRSEKQRIFIKLSEAYLRDFCQKHKLHFEGWVGSQTENIGQVAEFNGGMFYIHFDDIRYDIDNEIHPDALPNWLDHEGDMNYPHFCKYKL